MCWSARQQSAFTAHLPTHPSSRWTKLQQKTNFDDAFPFVDKKPQDSPPVLTRDAIFIDVDLPKKKDKVRDKPKDRADSGDRPKTKKKRTEKADKGDKPKKRRTARRDDDDDNEKVMQAVGLGLAIAGGIRIGGGGKMNRGGSRGGSMGGSNRRAH